MTINIATNNRYEEVPSMDPIDISSDKAEAKIVQSVQLMEYKSQAVVQRKKVAHLLPRNIFSRLDSSNLVFRMAIE